MKVHAIQKALELYQDGQYEAAADAFKQMGGADGACGEADCLYQLGRIEGAQEALNRCLALDPKHEDALALMDALACGPVPNGNVTEPPPDEQPCLSRQRNRPFVDVCAYPTKEDLNMALQAAREALPEVESAYRPSSKTTFSAVLSLLIITPFIWAFVTVLCGGLCLAWAFLKSYLEEQGLFDVRGASTLAALVSILLDIVLVIMIAFVPGLIYGGISRLLKNRKAWLPALLSAIVAISVSALLFLPLIRGQTLAPTDITFLFIPIRWLLIVGGFVLAPIAAAAFAHSQVSDQRFCELTGVFLSPVRTLHIAFAFGENAREQLLKGDYGSVVELPRCEPTEQRKHSAQIVLWWNERAETAFLEMKVFFRSIVFKSVSNESARSEGWLAFSTPLDRTTAEHLRVAYSE